MLTIAIPTYNNWEQLLTMLHTLTRYVEFPYRICVVNNGDEYDGLGQKFEDQIRHHIQHPEIQVLQARENLGWSKAVNWAFEEAPEHEFFCMANDDLVFIPYHRQFLRHLMRYFQHEEVGAVGPSSNFVMGSQSIFDHRGAAAFSTSLLIGFFMVVRSKPFAEVQGLDEALPGGDDLDLSIRFRKRGYKLLVDKTCYVHHIGSQTGQRLHPDYWNTTDQIETTNNMLIWKHGVRWWYETVQSLIEPFEPITQMTDEEGDVIRTWVKGLDSGIDVGCGSNKTVQEAIGIDKTPAGEMGRAGGQTGVESAADFVGDANRLPFPDGSQDYIVARHVFEHLLDPVETLYEWHRVLKDDGILAIACPDQNKCNSILLDWTHLHAYTPKTLTNMLEQFGFHVVAVEVIDPGFSFVVKSVKSSIPVEEAYLYTGHVSVRHGDEKIHGIES